MNTIEKKGANQVKTTVQKEAGKLFSKAKVKDINNLQPITSETVKAGENILSGARVENIEKPITSETARANFLPKNLL